jgi:hypothetical protein
LTYRSELLARKVEGSMLFNDGKAVDLLHLGWLLGVALLACAAGCKKDANPAPVPPRVQNEQPLDAEEIPSYKTDQLSELGRYLPPLDGGRIRIAPPAGWHPEPRDKSYVTRFIRDKTRRVPLPMITVKAEDFAVDDLQDLDADNHLEFSDLVADAMDETTRAALLERVDPLTLGDVRCARYVVKKTFSRKGKQFSGEREVIKTLSRGRVYTISLDVYKNQLVNFRGDAYAVVAGLEFPPPEADQKEHKKQEKTGEPESE